MKQETIAIRETNGFWYCNGVPHKTFAECWRSAKALAGWWREQ